MAYLQIHIKTNMQKKSHKPEKLVDGLVILHNKFEMERTVEQSPRDCFRTLHTNSKNAYWTSV